MSERAEAARMQALVVKDCAAWLVAAVQDGKPLDNQRKTFEGAVDTLASMAMPSPNMAWVRGFVAGTLTMGAALVLGILFGILTRG